MVPSGAVDARRLEGQGPEAISSQSRATALATGTIASRRPDWSIALRLGPSPESLCDHKTPGWARLTASPDLSVSSSGKVPSYSSARAA